MEFARLGYFVKDNKRVEYSWEGEAHLPVKLDDEYFFHMHLHKQPPPYPWNLRVIAKEYYPPQAIAVRTDIQPYWWIVVAFQYHLEETVKTVNRSILSCAYRLKLMDLEPGMMPHWGRVGLKFRQLLAALSSRGN